MAMQNSKEFFVGLLSNLRDREERITEILQELGEKVEDPDIKEALDSRLFLRNQVLSTLDRVFQLVSPAGRDMAPPPLPAHERLQLEQFKKTLVEEVRQKLTEISATRLRHLYVLAKTQHLVHLTIAEYVVLTAMADVTGHYGVGVLLESVLAEKRAFADRACRLLRRIVEDEVGARLA
jgi:ferritin-like metal-binding protein YciE